jgi:hypothetical protein
MLNTTPSNFPKRHDFLNMKKDNDNEIFFPHLFYLKMSCMTRGEKKFRIAAHGRWLY